MLIVLAFHSILFQKTSHAFLSQNVLIGNNFHISKSNGGDYRNSKPSITSSYVPKAKQTLLKSSNGSKGEEKALREELARKNEKIENEKMYTVLEGITAVDDDEVKTKDSEEIKTSAATTEVPTEKMIETNEGDSHTSTLTPFQEKMKRITKPRAYPLFLAETACNIAEDLISSFSKVTGNDDNLKETSPDGERKKIVVLGTGWGAAAFLKAIDTDKFDVTVISPRNFFLFTPMLAGASVGSVDFRSITEPVREINLKAKYLEATATEIDPKTSTIQCESVICEGNSCAIQDFSIDYDYIIYTVGAQTNTYGIPGVREYCCFLKQVEDASRIRTAMVNCFERANLPNLTDEERNNILTFAVIGAGPTGIEFASELRDFVEQDGPKYYPNLLKHVSIKVIEASSTVLAPFDKTLQNAAIQQLTRKMAVKSPMSSDLLPEGYEVTELLLESGVKEVKENVICLNNGEEIPYGLSVWAAGNGPLPITLQTIEALGSLSSEQTDAQSMARGRIAVDPWLRALGGKGKILALGDCSVNVEAQLPATAQVASQQGEYLARMFSKCDMDAKFSEEDSSSHSLLPPKKSLKNRKETLAEMISGFAINDSEIAAPFQFLNLGILAYTGDGSALAQLQVTPGTQGSIKGKGKIGFGLWRSVYLSKQVSWRNRFLVATDWVKAQFFGRDITRLS